MNTDAPTNAAPLTSFAFDSSALRSTTANGEPIFVAKDVCQILGISKHRDAFLGVPLWGRSASILVDAQTGGTGSVQTMSTVNEAGLYLLAFRSTKPEAERFQRWVCEEVLPAIRRQGGYVVGGSGEERIERLRGLLSVERSLLRLQARKAALLSGEPLPVREKRVCDAATPAGEIDGGIPIRDWLRSQGAEGTEAWIGLVAQRLARRLRVRECPVGKIRNAVNSWVLIARPADLDASLQPSDLKS
jgi:prophage antirepressor-like protein